MGHEQIGTTLRDRVAEIVSDARRPSQTTGNVTERDYAVADAIIAVMKAGEMAGKPGQPCHAGHGRQPRHQP